jgi:hypothetical protein
MIDFEKIKQKVAQLSGQGKKNNLWWPENGKEYTVRILPWPDGNNGQPMKERAFYRKLANDKDVLAPSQFGLPDPVQALITKLRNEGTPASLELAKKFYPKKKFYMPVIIRGEEEAGVRLWSLNKETLTSILNFMLGEFGDITDVKEGRDVIVKAVPSGRKWNGFDVMTTGVQPRLSQTQAGTQKQLKEWSSSIPNLDEIYKPMPAEEIEKHLDDLINGDKQKEQSVGTEKRVFANKNIDDVSEETSEIDDVFTKLNDIASDD